MCIYIYIYIQIVIARASRLIVRKATSGASRPGAARNARV